jgi:hypothetical protein
MTPLESVKPICAAKFFREHRRDYQRSHATRSDLPNCFAAGPSWAPVANQNPASRATGASRASWAVVSSPQEALLITQLASPVPMPKRDLDGSMISPWTFNTPTSRTESPRRAGSVGVNTASAASGRMASSKPKNPDHHLQCNLDTAAESTNKTHAVTPCTFGKKQTWRTTDCDTPLGPKRRRPTAPELVGLAQASSGKLNACFVHR